MSEYSHQAAKAINDARDKLLAELSVPRPPGEPRDVTQLTVAGLIAQLQAVENKDLLVYVEGCDCEQEAALVVPQGDADTETQYVLIRNVDNLRWA